MSDDHIKSLADLSFACGYPGYFTKKFFSQQGEGKIVAEMYNRYVEQAILPSTQLRGKFRSALHTVKILFTLK